MLRQDKCIGSGDAASPVTAGLHALPPGRGAASARPSLIHVERWFWMVFRPGPSGSTSPLNRENLRTVGGENRPESVVSLFLARCGLPALARTAVVAVGREIISHARTEKALQDSGGCEIHPPPLGH